MQTVIKVLGVAALIWIGIVVLGWVLGLVLGALGFAIKLVLWAVVLGAVFFVGSAAYAAMKGKSDRKALR